MITVSPLRRRRNALAAACAAAALVLTGCGTEQSTTSGDDESTPDAVPTQGQTTDGSDGPAPITIAVPLYFAGDAAGDVKLFREFQQVEGEALTEAAKLVDGGTPLDPDYRTLWPGETVTDAQAGGKVITVTLNGDAFTERPDGMTEREAWLAIQQMVHTLQGVEQSTAPVQFVRPEPDAEGEDEGEGTESPYGDTESGPTMLFGIDVTEPVKRGRWENLLAFVNVTVPSQDGTVAGDTLNAEGVASSFEATVPWQVLKDDEVVLEGFATAEGWMDQLYPWNTTVDLSDLEPGTYTFVAMTDDPSGGAEGPGPTSDSKEFTLQ